MSILITPRLTRNKKKIFYTLEWGKKAGQRRATGIFTYVHPTNPIQQAYNREASRLLEIQKAQLILEGQSIATGTLPAHKYKSNFLDFYAEYITNNRQIGNRHLEGSFRHFTAFIQKKYLSPAEVTEEVSYRFRKYLLDHLNGGTPANYFARFKKVLKSATRLGYFRISPSQDIPAKANKNNKRKNNLEPEEYIQLLKTPCLHEDVREAFIFCCYTGVRWCDIKSLDWSQVKKDSLVIAIIQGKTKAENFITLHPISQSMLAKRRARLESIGTYGRVFHLPTAEGANKTLARWCKNAGIEKHITWNCARLSFSILLQDANVDAATVALLLGHTTTKYVNETYKRHRPKDLTTVINQLPDPEIMPLIVGFSL